MSRRGLEVAVVGLLLLVSGRTLEAQSPQQPPDEPGAASSGITERTGVTLQLLDVEVLDREGRPIRGLTKDDFAVWIDARRVEVYSVDDLCDCPAPTTRRADARADPPSDSVDDGPPADPVALPPAGEAQRYVLYFDFSQLQLDGRFAAAESAERWIEESLPPGSEAMLAGYHSIAGLRELTPFTADKWQLVTALRASFDDPALVDPFPVGFSTRVRSCPECCARCSDRPCQSCCADECLQNPRREFEHGRRAYLALIRFLVRMESVPGRKSLVMFHQNSTTFPDRYYPFPLFIGDHLTLLDEVGAEATRSRTTVHAAFVGDLAGSPTDQAINVGANLADFTGGTYNRTVLTVDEHTRGVVRDCRCTYRIGIVPRGQPDNRVHRVRVEAAGRVVPYRYRLALLDETRRWWRSARSVLENPAAATDVGVRAALLPRGRTAAGWEVTAEVVLDVDSLMLLPSGGEQRGAWEVGALMHREGQAWEMLGVSSLRAGSRVTEGAGIAHERVFSKLRGGKYELGAFVRDRTANAFGGGESTLDLPRPGRAGIVGPIARVSDRAVWATDLPLRGTRRAAPESRTLEARMGSVPTAPDGVAQGLRLALETWICPATAGPPDSLIRFVVRGAEPLFRFQAARLEAAGDCFKLEDPIETSALEPGDYAYHVRWIQRAGEEPVEAHREFTVLALDLDVTEKDPTEDEPQPDPRLPAVLADLARVATHYRDRALRFTCDEVISYRSPQGRRRRHAFHYIYTHRDGQLKDYRVPHANRRNPDPSRAVHLASYGLPAYLVRAYSWVFVFGEEMQDRYRYRLLDETELLERPVLAVAFDPVPPYVADVNEWFGTAWIDRDSHQLLRVRAYHVQDRASVERHELASRRSGEPPRGEYGTWQRYDTVFDVHEHGMSFPGLVEIRRFVYLSSEAAADDLRRVSLVTQRYSDYRFFDVVAEPSLRRIPD